MFDIRYFWRAATVYARMLRRKKDGFHLFSYRAGYDIPCYRTTAQQAASSNLTQKVQGHEKLHVPREAPCSTFNDFFESELAFVAFQTPICFCFRFFVTNGAALL